jgi:hypothetical protein
MVSDLSIRKYDKFGSGNFGASRDGGTRSHNGLDIETSHGEPVYSPISGKIKRKKYPYGDDLSYEGCIISGADEWEDYEVTIFYVKMELNANDIVLPGKRIGVAQDLTKRFEGITNHIHIEVIRNGILINPTSLFGSIS